MIWFDPLECSTSCWSDFTLELKDCQRNEVASLAPPYALCFASLNITTVPRNLTDLNPSRFPLQ